MSYTVETIAQAPRDPALPICALGEWYVSIVSQQTWSYSPSFNILNHPNVTLDVWKWINPNDLGKGIDKHELDGGVYPSHAAADLAAYNAGLLGQIRR